MKLSVTGSATAVMPIRPSKLTGKEPTASASVVLNAEVPDGLPDEAISRMYILLSREAERFAQVSAVAKRDEQVNKLEAERIRNEPKDRPSIIIAVGTKDPEAVSVVRGSFMVGGKKMTTKGAGR